MRYEDDDPGFDDGSSSRYDDERNETLRSFAEQLCGDPRTIRYSEDEWIMLADYADDVDNFYLYSEAVIRGLCAYPDSAELADRHLMLLNRICRPDELHTAFEAAAGRPGASKIARLYNYFYQWSNSYNTTKTSVPLEKLYVDVRAMMLDGENLSDQEAIEVVRVAADMGLLHFIVKDKESWTALMDFPETFRYELCVTAFERYDVETASRMAEILVENYPYNFRYWILKSRIEVLRASEVEDHEQTHVLYDEAVNSIETALAINPDDSEALSLRQHIESLISNAGSRAGSDTRGLMIDSDGAPVDVETLLSGMPDEEIISSMSVGLLVCLLDSDNSHARDIVAGWVKHELDGYDNLDGTSIPRLLAFTAALYVLDRVDNVDYILDLAKHSYKRQIDYDDYLVLELIRLIERDCLDEADRLMTRIERTYGTGDASVAVLRSALDRHKGRLPRSENAYDTYRKASLDRIVDLTYPANERIGVSPEFFSTEFHDPNVIDAVTVHFLIRSSLNCK